MFWNLGNTRRKDPVWIIEFDASYFLTTFWTSMNRFFAAVGAVISPKFWILMILNGYLVTI